MKVNYASQSEVVPHVVMVDNNEYITYQWFCAEHATIGDDYYDNEPC